MLMFFDGSHRCRAAVPGLILMGIWSAALILGLLTAHFSSDVPAALFLYAGSLDLPFRGACLVTVLPLLLSVFTVYFFHRSGVYLLCAARGLSIGFLTGALASAGGLWLCALLLFSAFGSSAVLLWYLWRRLLLGPAEAFLDGLQCLFWCIALAAVDTWVVAPFLAAALSS